MNDKFGIFIFAFGLVANVYLVIVTPSGPERVAWMCSTVWVFNALMNQIELKGLKEKYKKLIENSDEEEMV